MTEENDETIRAIVQSVIKGKHGLYAVASSESIRSITFSLDTPVWKEKELPERGTYVLLSGITKKRNGWRAGEARYLKPSDDKQTANRQSSNQSKKARSKS